MRNLFYILLFISGIAFGQIDIKDNTKYLVYESDSIYSSHNNISNALENQLKLLRTGRSATIKAVGSVNVDLSSTFFEGGGHALEQYYKDTVITADYYNSGHGEYQNSINVRHYFHKYGDSVYVRGMEYLPQQPVNYVYDSIDRYSLDSVQVTRRYFLSKHGLISYRQNNSLESLKSMDFGAWVDNPGNAILNGQNVKRHTRTFRYKYFQARIKDTVFNTIDTLSIQGNIYNPG